MAMVRALHPHRSNSSLHCPLALPCKQGRFYSIVFAHDEKQDTDRTDLKN